MSVFSISSMLYLVADFNKKESFAVKSDMAVNSKSLAPTTNSNVR